MGKSKDSLRRKAIIWGAIGLPGVLAFMANTSAKEAASNIASWFELMGLPVPDFLTTVGIDEKVIQIALGFYALLGLGHALILKKGEPPMKEAVTN